MTYNLTEMQKNLARWLVAERQAGRLEEFFSVTTDAFGRAAIRDNVRFPFTEEEARVLGRDCPGFTNAALDALAAEGMLLVEGSIRTVRRFTFRRRLLDAVRNDFCELPALAPAVSGTPGGPLDLAHSLERLRRKLPDSSRLGFLVAPEGHDRVGDAVIRAVKRTAIRHGLAILCAAEQKFHADPWGNARTLMHACSFGVAVQEYSGGEEPSVNVGIETGYLLALGKPVLLLRGGKACARETDLMHERCEEFDEDDAARTVADQMERWLRSNGVIVTGGGQPFGADAEFSGEMGNGRSVPAAAAR